MVEASKNCVAHPSPARHSAGPCPSPFSQSTYWETTCPFPVQQNGTCPWSVVTFKGSCDSKCYRGQYQDVGKGQKGEVATCLASSI